MVLMPAYIRDYQARARRKKQAIQHLTDAIDLLTQGRESSAKVSIFRAQDSLRAQPEGEDRIGGTGE